MFKNQEGYHDPTAGQAMANIGREKKRKEEQRMEAERIRAIGALMMIIRQAADLAGMEIVGRITFRDKETGKEYK